MLVGQVTFEILREIEILSDTDGRNIFDLAKMFVDARERGRACIFVKYNLRMVLR